MRTIYELLSTRQAATELGVSIRRVQALISAGRMPGVARIGHAWLIPFRSLASVRIRRTGRPRKSIRNSV